MILPLCGWGFLGVSFLAVSCAVGLHGPFVEDALLLTGAAAWATTAGFIVLVAPAGLGVRELALLYLLAFRYAGPEAIVAALLLRIVWTGTEVVLADELCAILQGWRPKESKELFRLARW